MSIMSAETPGVADRTRGAGFRFAARTVTGGQVVQADGFPRATPAGTVAQSLAHRMELPLDVTWALREDRTGNYLEDERPIGDQIEEDAELTLTPKSHLG